MPKNLNANAPMSMSKRRAAQLRAICRAIAAAMAPQIPLSARAAAFDCAQAQGRALHLTDQQFARCILFVANQA